MVNLGELVFSIVAEDRASATVGATAQKIAGAGVAIGAGIGVAGAAATALIDANRGMDASFATTAASMGLPADAVKELARSLQSVDSPIEEVAATLDILARGGMTNVDSMGATASAFDTLADATGQNADALTDAMVPAFNALGIELEKAPAYVDGLAVMFRKSNVDLGDFSTMMTRMGPDLGEMGMGLTDVEAILMSFADRGITGRKATTELTEAINAADGDISKFYDSIGLTEGELQAYGAQVSNVAGTAQEFADAQNSQFGTMDKFAFEITKLKQGLGDVLKPFEGVASAAMVVGPAIAMVVPAAVSLAGAIGAGGGLAAVVGGLSATVMGAAGALAAFLAPLIAPIAVIAAVVAGLYLLNKQFNFVGGIVEWLGGVFEGFASWLGDTFGPIIDGVIGFVGELFGEMEDGEGPIEMVLGLFKDLGDVALRVGGFIGSVLGPAIQAVATWIGETLGPAIKGVVGFFGDLWEEVNKAGGVFERARDVIVAAWNVIASLFGGGDGNGVVVAIKGLWDAVLAYVPVAWGSIIQAVGTALVALGTWILTNGPPLVVAAMQAIWTAITVTIPTAWAAIQTAVATAAGLIWTWLSTEGVRLAGAAVASIWTWIQGAVPAAWSAIQAAVVAAAQAIWAWLTGEGKAGADTAVKSIWSTIAGAVPDAWKAIMAAVLAAARAIWSWLSGGGAGEAKSAIGAAWSAIAGAVPDAWKAIQAAVESAARRVWNAAKEILGKPIEMVVTTIQRTVEEVVQGATTFLGGGGSSGTTYSPSNVVSDEKRYDSDGVQVGGNSSRSYYGDYIYSPDGHKIGRYIGGKATYYHSGGIAENEQLAVLLKNERVLSPAQTKEYDAGLLSAVQALAAKIDQLGGSGGGDVIVHGDVKLSEDYSYDRFREDVGRWKSSRIAKGVL